MLGVWICLAVYIIGIPITLAIFNYQRWTRFKEHEPHYWTEAVFWPVVLLVISCAILVIIPYYGCLHLISYLDKKGWLTWVG